MLKSVGLALVALASLTSNTLSPQHEAPQTIRITNQSFGSSIRQITCNLDERSVMRGTAFQIRPGKWISAYHVVARQGCYDSQSGTALRVTGVNIDLDYAELEGHVPNTQILPYTCDRMNTGQSYFTVGYAYGRSRLLNSEVIAINEYTTADTVTESGSPAGHLRNAEGVLAQGMSGGPVMNSDNLVFAINSSTLIEYGFGYFRELADTPLCNG